MQFKDKIEESDFDFMLRNAFYHVPAGVRTTGDFAGEKYDEFWWRSCALEPDDLKGTGGYLIVWLHEDGSFNTHHTYHYPPEIYT